MSNEYHVPVMLNECLDSLQINPNGIYVDVTFGGGGHSKAILNQLEGGTLVAFDQDVDAAKNADLVSVVEGADFKFIEANFRHLKKYLKVYGIEHVDGILADLGVSSFQIDEPTRGFSTRAEGVLDMRMNENGKLSAIEVLNEYKESDLIHLLSAYGEVKNARTLASALIAERLEREFTTVEQLREVVIKCSPRGRENKYLAQVFQAIRIEVNDELGALKEFLIQSDQVLRKGGRLVVMSYHSLEDRLVKNYINKGNLKGRDEKDFFGNPLRAFDPVNRKPIVASSEEISLNNRARSAKLRVGVKR